MFTAEKGKGAFWNGRQIFVSNQQADKAMITLGPSHKPEDRDLLQRYFSHARQYVNSFRYLGSAALELCYLARGGTEGFISIGLSKWDYAAGALLVLEANGMMTDFNGNPWTFAQNYFLASNGAIHPQLLELTKTVG
jgi:myo-inositol-1(or 4)-monophosphatase